MQLVAARVLKYQCKKKLQETEVLKTFKYCYLHFYTLIFRMLMKRWVKSMQNIKVENWQDFKNIKLLV